MRPHPFMQRAIALAAVFTDIACKDAAPAAVMRWEKRYVDCTPLGCFYGACRVPLTR